MEYILFGWIYLLIAEPTLQLYPVLDHPPSQVAWGPGFRVRVPVSAHDALRLRLEGANRNAEAALPKDEHEHYIAVAVDYLRGGRDWNTRWYWGLGAGWFSRERPLVDQGVVTTNTATGTAILGRALNVGPGQFVLEGRFELEGFEGGVSSAVAMSVAYRHHFHK